MREHTELIPTHVNLIQCLPADERVPEKTIRKSETERQFYKKGFKGDRKIILINQ